MSDEFEVINETELYEAPDFVKPLRNFESILGEPFVAEVEVSGYPKPRIQWFHNQKIINDSEDFQITTEEKKSKLFVQKTYDYCLQRII